MHAVRGQGQHGRDHLALAFGIVVGEEQVQAALAVGFGHAAFGFKKGMHLARRLVGRTDAVHGGRIGSARIAQQMVMRMQQIAARMQHRRLGQQRGFGASHGRQQFVLDHDQVQCRMRDVQ